MGEEPDEEGYRKLGPVSEIEEGQLRTFESGDEHIVVANVGGQFYAMGAICKHEEWDLSEGTLVGNKIICAGHGAEWDLQTGKAAFHEPLESEPLYDVKVHEGMIFLKPRR